MKRTKLPIGIQNFRDFHRDGFIYVDKTEYIHRLVWQGKYYFLSRPRRFGKSLLVSTLKELFSGSQELFEGLWIYDKWDWTKTSPVIHLSFTCLNYQDRGLDVAISSELDEIAASYQIDLPTDMPYKDKFKALLKQVSAKHGEIVLLIDEYDKPIIDYLEYEKLPQAKENQGIMKNFYSVLKDSGAYLRFVFITGVSKFSKVSIFSDLNHLDDLTLHPDYALLTGYTQADLEFYFADYLTSATERLKMNRVDVIQRVREWYNGFSWDGINTVYNPFGTLLFLAQHDFRNYWSETGTPTFLFEQMKKQENFEYENVVTSSDLLNKYDLNNLEMVALLFQTGYLTVKKRDFINGEIVLDYPNREVRSSLYGFLIDNLTPNQSTPPAVVAVQDLNRAFLKDDLDKVKNIIGTGCGSLYSCGKYLYPKNITS